MPAACLIHEKQFAHEVLMTLMAMEVPEIGWAPLVTDGAENIMKAINNCLQMCNLRCWNTFWATSAKNTFCPALVEEARSNNCSVYSQDIKQLLTAVSQNFYKQQHTSWVRHSCSIMMPMLNQKCCPLVAGGWILKPLGISTNGYSRVTANQSEDFNTLIKQLTRFTGTGCVLPHSATKEWGAERPRCALAILPLLSQFQGQANFKVWQFPLRKWNWNRAIHLLRQ